MYTRVDSRNRKFDSSNLQFPDFYLTRRRISFTFSLPGQRIATQVARAEEKLFLGFFPAKINIRRFPQTDLFRCRMRTDYQRKRAGVNLLSRLSAPSTLAT